MSRRSVDRRPSQERPRKSSLSDPNKPKDEVQHSEEKPVKVLKNRPKTEEEHLEKRPSKRRGRNMERVELLARPNARRLRSLWDEKSSILPPDRRDKIKSALEEDYFLSPEQTEIYFQALRSSGAGHWTSNTVGGMAARKERADREKELKQRQKWLINFSAQVACQLSEYMSKCPKDTLVSNRLRSIADVVLERVADILGERKPSRTNSSRLARFMVAISDRIAVWIENAVYRADALEEEISCHSLDQHMRLDNDKPLIA